MKLEDVMKTLIEELFKMDTLHHEYTDNDVNYVIDSLKEGNTLTIKVSLNKNEDKEKFEKWLETVDDSLFGDVLDELRDEGLYDLESIYNSKDYHRIIDKVKAKTKEIASRRIKDLQKFID